MQKYPSIMQRESKIYEEKNKEMAQYTYYMQFKKFVYLYFPSLVFGALAGLSTFLFIYSFVTRTYFGLLNIFPAFFFVYAWFMNTRDVINRKEDLER